MASWPSTGVGLVIIDHIGEFDDLCVVTVNLPPRFGSRKKHDGYGRNNAQLVVSTHFKNSSYFIKLDQLKKSVSPNFGKVKMILQIFPIGSMYGIFTYMNGGFLWFSCREIYHSHGSVMGLGTTTIIDSPHQNTKNIRMFWYVAI